MKKAIACVATATVLSVGAGSAAFAAEADPSTETTQPAAQGEHRGVRRVALRTAARAAAEAIGVEPSELREAFKAGTSVAALAESKGVDVATVTDAIVAALSAKVDEALANGKIDEERATKAKERLPELAERLVNRTPKG